MIKVDNNLVILDGDEILLKAEISSLLREMAKEIGIEEMLKVSLLAVHSAEVPDDELADWLDEIDIEFEYHGLTENGVSGKA